MSFSWLEMAGFGVTLVSVWLVIKELRSGWLWSVLSALIYLFIYWDAKLYSDAELQLLYIAVGVYGFINWNKRKKDVPIIKVISTSAFLSYILIVLFSAAAWGSFHSLVTDASLPYLDALLASTCIVAQWMMARKYFQCWYLWIFAGVGYIWMYIAKDLVVTTILYIILLLITFYGYWKWKMIKNRDHTKQTDIPCRRYRYSGR
jgi:nicotinamide mononucleotide transporter